MRLLKKRRDGFSMTEMLVVLAIMGLILGLVGPRILGYLGAAKSKTAQLQIDNLKSAMSLYFIQQGRYPTEAEGLEALAPYLQDGETPTDPWGRAFGYRVPGDNGRPFVIFSLGADGARGGDGENADVTG